MHPDIASTIPSAPAIADVGTGTGIWILHAAREYGADGYYHGFDLSDEQFISHYNLPSHVKLHGGIDMKKSFPDEYHGKFDVVHVRLLVLAMAKDDWANCVINLRTLLKPGGYIQWEEGDFNHLTKVMRSNPNAQTKNLKRGFERLNQLVSHRTRLLPDALVGAFHETGMQEVVDDEVSSDRLPALRHPATMILIGVLEGVSKQQAKDNITDAWSFEKGQQLVKSMRREAYLGGYVNFWIHSVVGRN